LYHSQIWVSPFVSLLCQPSILEIVSYCLNLLFKFFGGKKNEEVSSNLCSRSGVVDCRGTGATTYTETFDTNQTDWTLQAVSGIGQYRWVSTNGGQIDGKYYAGKIRRYLIPVNSFLLLIKSDLDTELGPDN